MITNLDNLIKQYKSDPESVYNTWFINNVEIWGQDALRCLMGPDPHYPYNCLLPIDSSYCF